MSAAPVASPFKTTSRIKSQARDEVVPTSERPKSVTPKQARETSEGSQKLPLLWICNHPTNNPPDPNPIFVGIRIDPAATGEYPLTERTKIGVKNKRVHRALMKPSCAKHDRRTPLDERTLSGMMGSAATRYSYQINKHRPRRDNISGVHFTSPESPYKNKTMAQHCSQLAKGIEPAS